MICEHFQMLERSGEEIRHSLGTRCNPTDSKRGWTLANIGSKKDFREAGHAVEAFHRATVPPGPLGLQ